MQSGRVKSAADVRDVGERVQLAEHADAIDEDDVGVARAAGSSSRATRSFDALAPSRRCCATCCGVGSCGAMISRSVDSAASQRLERREQHRLVRPATSSRRRASGASLRSRCEHRTRAVDALRAQPHLVVSRVARDDDGVRANAELHEPVGVGVVDRADDLERRVGVAQQRAAPCASAATSRATASR